MKKDFFLGVKTNILKYKYHLTIVSGAPLPRYAYTIGLYQTFGYELIFAGGLQYSFDDVNLIFKQIINVLLTEHSDLKQFNLDRLGIFRLSKADQSWTDGLMLGVFNYYNTPQITAFQILPDENHMTMDVPNMETGIQNDSIWKWLRNKWDYRVNETTNVVTDLDVLKGKPVTELMRWDLDDWELFSRPQPEIKELDIRVVPFGVLLGLDHTLSMVLDLDVGKGMWREDYQDVWHPWG